MSSRAQNACTKCRTNIVADHNHVTCYNVHDICFHCLGETKTCPTCKQELTAYSYLILDPKIWIAKHRTPIAPRIIFSAAQHISNLSRVFPILISEETHERSPLLMTSDKVIVKPQPAQKRAKLVEEEKTITNATAAAVCVLCQKTDNTSTDNELHFLGVLALLVYSLEEIHNTRTVTTTTSTKKLDDGKKKGIGYGGSNYQSHTTTTKKNSVSTEQDDSVSNMFKWIHQYLQSHQHYLQKRTISDKVLAFFPHSQLPVILLRYLRNDSLLDLTNHYAIYFQIFQLLQFFAKPELGLSYLLFCPASYEAETLLSDCVLRMSEQADFYLKTAKDDHDDVVCTNLCTDIKVTFGMIKVYSARHYFFSPNVPATTTTTTTTNNNNNTPDNKLYDINLMGHTTLLQYIKAEPNKKSSECIRRIRKEITSLKSAIPDGIYLRYDEARLDVLRFLIIGPSGTPYEHGFYLFDMYIPNSYPQTPPQVKFITTGQGQFRFNPNLYSCGKVCLSLLGTWAGPSWEPNESTLLQIFMSIQSMILIDEPYFNEPGYANSEGTSQGRARSNEYNRCVRQGTVHYALLDVLETHKSLLMHGFEDVILPYIAKHSTSILQNCHKWFVQDPSKNIHYKTELGIVSSLAVTVPQLEKAIQSSFTV